MSYGFIFDKFEYNLLHLIMDHAERISQELRIERANIWYISDHFGKKIMIKAPSTLLNVIIKGYPMELLFGKDDRQVFPIFLTGLRIYDDPIHFTRVSGIHRYKFEHQSLLDIMQVDNVHLELYNELNIPFASTILTVAVEDRNEVLSLLSNIDELYTGAYNDFTAKSVDCFDYSFDDSLVKPHTYKLKTIHVRAAFSNWQMAKNLIVGYNENNEFGTPTANEGDTLEKQILVPLESLFQNKVYRNPQIRDKYGFRELTDVFAFHDYGIFLIESKALTIKEDMREKSMERKIKGLQKQVSKAIDQLKGATRKISQKTEVFDSNGSKIAFETDKPPHCIVLISDLLPFGDWGNILKEMFQAMIDQPMFLHLMDLTDLMTYIGYSKGKSEMFDYYLLERSDELVKQRSVFIRAGRSGE